MIHIGENKMKDIKKRLVIVYALMGLYFAFQAGSYSREAELNDLRCERMAQDDYIEELQDGGK